MWSYMHDGLVCCCCRENRDTPATLLIVDRVDDIAPALMHDLTYGSLIVDLLSHDPCTVRVVAVLIYCCVCFVFVSL